MKKVYMLVVLIMCCITNLCFSGGNSEQLYTTDLIEAIKEEDINAVTELLNNGANVEEADSEGNTPLYIAVINGNPELVSLLLSFGANPNYVHPYNYDTALLVSLWNNNKTIVNLLLENEADPNLAGNYIYSPLMLATIYDNSDIAASLIRFGASVNVTDNSAFSVLDYAKQLDHNEIYNLLTEHGAKENMPSKPIDIYITAQYGSYQSILRAVQLGADINNVSDQTEYRTPLNLAILAENIETAKALIDAGADLEITDEYDDTPLINAILIHNSELALKLIDANANIDIKRRNNDSALICALKEGENPIASYLISSGCNVDSIGENGQTPLIVAINTDSIELIMQLLNAGADVNIQDSEELSAIDYACQIGNNEIINAMIFSNQHLLNFDDIDIDFNLCEIMDTGNIIALENAIVLGAEIDKQNTDGQTPIQHAVSTHNIHALNILIEAKCNINFKDPNKRTPLINAVILKQIDTVKALLAAGAKLNEKDNQGYTALDYAIERNDEIMATLLIASNANARSIGSIEL